MPSGFFFGLIAGTALLSAIGVGVMRRFALSRAIMDIPNHRSSHVLPTPRGGGLAVVLVVLAGLACTRGVFPNQDQLGLVILVGGPFVALLGWLDDCYQLSAGRRFLGHILVSGLAVVCLSHNEMGLLQKVFQGLIVAWSINLFNFMDGMDGLAGTEAVMAGFAGAALSAHFSNGPFILPLLLASASLGFLWWNWPPAKIFLGDVGSGFYGYAFGCLTIAGGWGFRGGAAMWTILLGMFWFDSTFTLLRRIICRERFWEAHRTHFYQQAALAGWSHRSVVLVFMGGNSLLILMALTLCGDFM